MACTAILRHRDMRCRLHLRIDRAGTIVAIGTGSRRALEYTLDVAAFASGVGMHPGQGEFGLVMVETGRRPRPLGGHQ